MKQCCTFKSYANNLTNLQEKEHFKSQKKGNGHLYDFEVHFRMAEANCIFHNLFQNINLEFGLISFRTATPCNYITINSIKQSRKFCNRLTL